MIKNVHVHGFYMYSVYHNFMRALQLYMCMYIMYMYTVLFHKASCCFPDDDYEDDESIVSEDDEEEEEEEDEETYRRSRKSIIGK